MMERRPFESALRGVKHPNSPNDKKPANNGGSNGMLPAFFPGQRAALADQLNEGFGGGDANWQRIMAKTYAPIRNAANFRYGSLGGNGGGGGNNHSGPAVIVEAKPGGLNPGSPIGQQTGLSPEMLAMIRDSINRRGT